jgi:hypothetical protein
MTFFARLRKPLGTPRHCDPCCFDSSGTIPRAGERGGHSLAFYLGSNPHFSQGQLRFEARVEDRRETMGTVAPKALIAIWF